MNLEIVILGEVTQLKADIIWYHLYMESKKRNNGTNKLYLQNGNRVADIEKELIVTKGEREGKINWEIGIDIYALLYIKLIANMNLLYSMGGSTFYNDLYGKRI